MSKLSRAIERYANGIADASEVIEALPKPKVQKPKPTARPQSLGELADSEKTSLAMGTWEEVDLAFHQGVLSHAQYTELYEAYS